MFLPFLKVFVGTCVVCILYQSIMKLLPNFHYIITDCEHVFFIAWVTIMLYNYVNLGYIQQIFECL